VPKFAANLTMLFGEQPFLDRFAAAKAAGFSGVEYLFPYDSTRPSCASCYTSTG
jgi:hydroxypyruvate isomerase